MAEATSTSSDSLAPALKRVPQDAAVREAVRSFAARLVGDMDRRLPPDRADLEARARRLLDSLSLPPEFLGFAMVAISNAFWRPQLDAIPFDRRLLFLPCCLRDRDLCRGAIDATGLTCIGCRECALRVLKTAAEEIGYRVIVADGTPAVLMQLVETGAEAIVGVACLDSLEKAFSKVNDIGIPCIAAPLLKDGCANTVAETEHVLALLRSEGATPAVRPRSYAPLLRESALIFAPENLARILRSVGSNGSEPSVTDSIAEDWIECGGKRFRPFVTLAAYAVSRYGSEALSAGPGLLIPESIKALAVAIEVLHKASLVHDDIEDSDDFRYGVETLHRKYGIGPAINVGDFLIGMGYRLIAAQAGELGAECTADILGHLSAAHLELCRGQGDELLWQRSGKTLRPADALSIYARKTAPAFETALYAGVRAARPDVEKTLLHRFALYVGEAYQVRNDLEDWRERDGNKVAVGADATAGRPTILRAFAIEAGAADRLDALSGDREGIRALYVQLGVLERAERLVKKLRDRAAAAANETPDHAFKDLLLFILRVLI